MSANIADGHSGFIKVKDGPEGRGAWFSVYLPAQSDD